MSSPASWNFEIESPVAAPRLFCAALLDWHNLAPKFAPEIVVSATVIEGNGGVGSVRQFNFSSAMPFTYTKERLDYVDHDKYESKQTLIEGGGIGVKLESASSHIKFEPASNGGCVCKVVATYKLLPGAAVDDEIAKAKDSITEIIKTAEAYLLANPDAYV
ncbi:Pathogenesis-related protein 1 [Ananas comosus]|uniref:Pathogenesis-related protein 1 n=1 Tax=Ananas comosus TaxID=4615 RepID=A0A199US79_ANACO|nr:Pathogenesis-related protein 1 [Ananas comosus]